VVKLSSRTFRYIHDVGSVRGSRWGACKCSRVSVFDKGHIPVTSVGHDSLGAVQTLFVHWPYRHCCPRAQGDPKLRAVLLVRSRHSVLKSPIRPTEKRREKEGRKGGREGREGRGESREDKVGDGYQNLRFRVLEY
jgi:hypothetical protein